MKLRIMEYLSNIIESDGVTLSANLQCTCGATEFQFYHTGKQTKGILAPFIVGKQGQLVLKAECPHCLNSIIVYDSSKDSSNPKAKDSATEFIPFNSNKVSKQFPIVIKYNYFPEKLKIEESYSNYFENCFIYIVDKSGGETKALIEE